MREPGATQKADEAALQFFEDAVNFDGSLTDGAYVLFIGGHLCHLHWNPNKVQCSEKWESGCPQLRCHSYAHRCAIFFYNCIRRHI